MFIQVITGTVNDVEGFRKQDQRWHDELEAGATGFLGSTAGATDDGRFLVSARFESADAAKRNSERPEQGAWWAETEKYLSDVEFHDSNKQTTLFGGGSDDATFVQVMRGRVTDRDKIAAARVPNLGVRVGPRRGAARRARRDDRLPRRRRRLHRHRVLHVGSRGARQRAEGDAGARRRSSWRS